MLANCNLTNPIESLGKGDGFGGSTHAGTKRQSECKNVTSVSEGGEGLRLNTIQINYLKSLASC